MQWEDVVLTVVSPPHVCWRTTSRHEHLCKTTQPARRTLLRRTAGPYIGSRSAPRTGS